MRLMFRSSKPQPLQQRQTYIPPHIQNAMTQHLQQTMPAHLKKYQGGNTYIPEHAQAEIAQHLENSLPSHMKQYAGAYTEQHVVEPSLARRGAVRTPVEEAPAAKPAAATAATQVFTPNLAMAGAAAGPGNIQPVPGQSVDGPAAPGPGVVVGGSGTPNTSPNEPYDFITNAPKTPKEPLLTRLPGGNSTTGRIVLVLGAVLILLTIFLIFKSLLTRTPNLDNFVTIAQQQQEIIHLNENAIEEQTISATNMTFASTVQATMSSSQKQTISYLTANHKKINAKQLNAKVSATTDSQLEDAAAATTYNQTFQEIMQAKLDTYGKTLQQTYKLTKGKKGRALLQDEYRQLQLYKIQLNPQSS